METISGVQTTADPRQLTLWSLPTCAGADQTGAQPRSGRSEAEASEGGGEADAGQAPAHGLVIYPKTGRSCLGDLAGDVPDTPEEAFVLGFRFPSAADVADAGVVAELVLRGDVAGGDRAAREGSGAPNFDRHTGARSVLNEDGKFRVPDGGSSESLTFALRIAAGAVTLSASNPDRAARRAEKGAARSAQESALSARLAEWMGQQCPAGVDGAMWWAGLDDEARSALMSAGASAVGAAHLSDRRDSDREVTEWSRKSRANMVKALAELDYSSIEGKMPVMVTLTYPRCWLRVAPDGGAVKAHLKAFRKRFERRYGPLLALWKLEFQGRRWESRCYCESCCGGPAPFGTRDDGRAPHIHLWLPRPSTQIVRQRGKDSETVPETVSGFEGWLSEAWADIVAHQDPVQRLLHSLAGTAVDRAAGLRGSDPKRLAIYFSKHGGADGNSKEYQHWVPTPWQLPGAGPGRFWGYWRFERVAVSVTLSPDDFVRAKRLLRRWSRSRAAYRAGHRFPSEVFPATTRRRRPRGSGFRWSRSRRQLFDHAGMSGGFACVNHGADLSVSLSKALRPGWGTPPPYWERSDFLRSW